MKQEQIEFKPLSVSHYTPREIGGNYTEIEDMLVTDRENGGKQFTLRRFIAPNEFRCKVGQVYKGRKKDKEPPYKFDTINETIAIDGWGGNKTNEYGVWDYTDPVQEQLKKEAKMESYGHIHSATSLLGGMSLDSDEETIIEKIIWVADICREAHKRYAEQLYNELKAKNGKGEK